MNRSSSRPSTQIPCRPLNFVVAEKGFALFADPLIPFRCSIYRIVRKSWHPFLNVFYKLRAKKTSYQAKMFKLIDATNFVANDNHLMCHYNGRWWHHCRATVATHSTMNIHYSAIRSAKSNGAETQNMIHLSYTHVFCSWQITTKKKRKWLISNERQSDSKHFK